MASIIKVILALLPTFCSLIEYSICMKNILYMAYLPSPSHHIWNKALADGLALRGHNVTYLSADKIKGPTVKNNHHILVEGTYEALKVFEMNDGINLSKRQQADFVFQWGMVACNHTVHSKALEQLLNYPPDFFDAIIIDVTCGMCFLPLIETFNFPPTIAVTPYLLPPYISYFFGNHLQPSYIPALVTPFTTNMNFIQRLENYFLTYYDILMRQYYLIDKEMAVVREVIKGTKSWQELVEHVHIVLANTDPILSFSQPLSPNFIPVGGLQSVSPKPLPADLQDILNKSTEGVIVFSLGSNIRSDKLGYEKINAFLKAFGRLKQTVLWKFESDNLENKPNNVIIRKWLPQSDVLAHPNVKLFIGHGGALSTQEAVYHGVPTLGIPFFTDQFINVKVLAEKGAVVEMEFFKLTDADYIYSNVNRLLTDKSYYKNMKMLSQIFRNQPATPLQRAVFHVENAMLFDSGKHYSSPMRKMSFFVIHHSDIYLFIVVLLSAIYYLFRKILCLLYLTNNSKIKAKSN